MLCSCLRHKRLQYEIVGKSLHLQHFHRCSGWLTLEVIPPSAVSSPFPPSFSPALHSILQSTALQLPLWSHWFLKISEAAVEIGPPILNKTHQLLCLSSLLWLVGTAMLSPTVQHCRNRRKAELIYIQEQFHRDRSLEFTWHKQKHCAIPWPHFWRRVKWI